MNKAWHYTLREVLADVFVDKDSDFDLDVTDSLFNKLLHSSKHVCETS